MNQKVLYEMSQVARWKEKFHGGGLNWDVNNRNQREKPEKRHHHILISQSTQCSVGYLDCVDRRRGDQN